MAGTLPHAVFVEVDVDDSGTAVAFAGELPGCWRRRPIPPRPWRGFRPGGRVRGVAPWPRRSSDRAGRQLVRGRARRRSATPRGRQPRDVLLDEPSAAELADVDALGRAGERTSLRRSTRDPKSPPRRPGWRTRILPWPATGHSTDIGPDVRPLDRCTSRGCPRRRARGRRRRRRRPSGPPSRHRRRPRLAERIRDR